MKQPLLPFFLCLALLGPVWGQDAPDEEGRRPGEPPESLPWEGDSEEEGTRPAPTPEGRPGIQGNLRELESWLILEEEIVPDPPLIRLELGFLGVIETRSQIRVDRRGLRGTSLEDLEENQGLESGALGPWVSFSFGGKLRGGGEALYFERRGEFTQQEEAVLFDGIEIAAPGDFVRTRFAFLSLSSYVEWDILYGRRYRIGLLGGLRYFRLDIDLEGALLNPTARTVKRRVRGELLSPSFGGLIELTPFPYLTVFSQAQFMNWSWEDAGLARASYFEFRIGAKLNVIPDFLSLSLEYRFLNVKARPTLGSRGGRVEGSLSANGLSFSIGLAF